MHTLKSIECKHGKLNDGSDDCEKCLAEVAEVAESVGLGDFIAKASLKLANDDIAELRQECVDLRHRIQQLLAEIEKYRSRAEHYFLALNEDDTETCFRCGLNIRDPIHKREPPNAKS